MNLLTLTVSLADQRFAQTKSLGIFNFSLGLSRALAQSSKVERLTLLTNSSLPLGGKPDPERVVLTDCAPGNAGKLWRLWWEQLGVYHAARRAGNQWLLLPKGYASFLRDCPVRLATYVHDAMQEHYRRRYPRGLPLFENFYFHAGFRAAIAHSQIILTNTQFTAGEIQSAARHYGLKKPRIEVIGVGFERPPQMAPSERSRILVLASRWPHKRTALAIQYISRWQEERKFAGPVDWIGQLPAGLALPKTVNWHLHARVEPEDLNRFLAEARASVYFSDYEGFGMPPVEAAIAGACPVYSDIPATREVMQGRGFCFSNGDYKSFAAALDEALRTPHLQVENWADQLLLQHNWQDVAERVISALG